MPNGQLESFVSSPPERRRPSLAVDCRFGSSIAMELTEPGLPFFLLKRKKRERKMKKLGLFSLAVVAAITISPAAKADEGFEIHYVDAQTGGTLIDTTLYVDAVSQSAATCGGSATECYLVDALDTNYVSTGFDLVAYPGTGTFTPGGIIPAGTTSSAWSDNVVDNLLSVDAGGNVSFNPDDPLGGLGYTGYDPALP